MKRLLFSILSIWLSVFAANAMQSDTFQLANTALSEGKVDDAIQLYTTLADKGYGSATLYYNLGTAYAQKESWGKARLFLERAQLEKPLSKEIEQNLEYVKDEVGDLYHFPAYPLSSFIKAVHNVMGQDILAICLWIFFAITLMMLFRWKVKKAAGQWQLLTYIFGSILLLVLTLFLLERAYLKFHDKMVIASNTKEVYQVPDNAAATVVSLRAGYKLRVLEDLGEWKRIDLSDGTEGWITSQDLMKVVDIKKAD